MVMWKVRGWETFSLQLDALGIRMFPVNEKGRPKPSFFVAEAGGAQVDVASPSRLDLPLGRVGRSPTLGAHSE
ncbi:hypothetical protein [Variovorax rhizosphaerae]|uniref:Uncharacterized protein n=1 Tax=Variovorax rhizosphaerae TaxID=1836200 RepID=A0ABU8WMQ4_9BURK